MAEQKAILNIGRFCILLTRYILLTHSIVAKITFGSHTAFDLF